MINRLTIPTTEKKQVIDLTGQINDLLREQERNNGICSIFVTHTTCGLTTGEVGEGTAEDLLEVIETIIPKINFRHAHNPSHAWTHMASSILGASIAVPFTDKKLLLGTWQSIMLVELDGPRERTVVVSTNE